MSTAFEEKMKLSMIKTSTALAVVLTVCAASFPVTSANAASIRVKWEKRANCSTPSVDGNKLVAGNFKAIQQRPLLIEKLEIFAKALLWISNQLFVRIKIL